MLRSVAITAVACLSASCLLAVAPAFAQPAHAASEVSSCPSDRLSIYYARGDAAPSAQAQVLIARIGDEAAQCQPDGIDLVTEIDTSGDGDGAHAIALALARLNNIAEALIAKGVPADRIRVAAQPSDDLMRAPMGEVGVLFRKSPVSAGDASAPRAPIAVQQQRDLI